MPDSWERGRPARNGPKARLIVHAGGTPALPGKQISFCNTSHWASLGWFVGSELMGNADVALYDGSMVEWSADESLPMERRISIE